MKREKREALSAKAQVDGIQSFLALEPRSRVLDLGCASGRGTLALARRGHRVLGIDPDERALAIARAAAKGERLNIHFMKADPREISYRGDFDAVVCLDGAFGRLPSARKRRQKNADQQRDDRHHDEQLALFAPTALVALPLVWMLTVTVGFAAIFWGIDSGSVTKSIEISGSSLFTLGFSEPSGAGRTWLTFAHSISAAASRSSGRPADSRSRRVTSDTRLIFESSTRGGAPPSVDGQK